MRTSTLDKSSLQLQSKRITDNLSDVVRIERNGSKQFKVGLESCQNHRFSLQYLWKMAIRITKKPYTPQRERLCMLWETL